MFKTDLSIGQFLFAIWRARWLVLACLVVSLVGAAVAVKSLPKRYTATGLLALETQQPTVPELKDILAGTNADSAIVRSEAEVLSSRALAETVVRYLALEALPEFNPALAAAEGEASSKLPGWLQNLAKALPSQASADGPQKSESASDPRSLAVEHVLSNLKVRTGENSYVISVAYESLDPRLAAEVVNTLMEVYTTNQALEQVDRAGAVNSWLEQRLAEMRRQVEAADAKMQNYREVNSVLETKSGSVSAQQLAEMNTQLIEAQTARVQAEARFRQARAMLRSPDSADGSLDVVASRTISELRDQEAELIRKEGELSNELGELHPKRIAVRQQLADLRANIQHEVQRVVQSLGNEAEIARQREAMVNRRFEELQQDAQVAAKADVELRQLEREAETKRELYLNLLKRYQETNDLVGIERADARIVSAAAVPTRPSSPKSAILVALAGIVGLLIGSALALILNLRDTGVETLEDLQGLIKTRGLGTIPDIRRGPRLKRVPANYVVTNPESSVSETLRGIRAALEQTASERKPKIVMVTSALPGEGKTSFVTALGRVAAADGLKTLVVDGDLRRPTVGRVLGSVGSLAIDEVVNEEGEIDFEQLSIDPETGLHYLPGRGRVKNANSPKVVRRLREFLEQAAKRYDLVLLDTSPLMLVADALVMASMADQTILVSQWRSTRCTMIKEAAQRLRSTGASVAGSVLTRARGKLPKQYVYGGYGRQDV